MDKRFRKSPLLLLAFICLICSSYAQEKYQVIHWDVKDGLGSNDCSSILKDKYGFIWFAQWGLSRFDGKKFINYDQPCNRGLTEDSLHNIWIGSGAGLSRFDILADSFSLVYPKVKIKDSEISVVPFQASRDEVFCVENASQITAYNIYTPKKRIIVKEFHIKRGAGDPFRFHFSILDPTGKTVWMLDNGGLTELTLSNGALQYYPLPILNNLKGQNPDAPGMCYDKKRNLIWLNTSEGLVQFDLRNKQFNLLPALNDLLNKKNADVYPGISIDQKGMIWFSKGKPLGIQVYDPESMTVTPAIRDPDLQQKVSEDNMCLYCDRNGTIWTGKFSRKGIYQLNPFSQIAYRYVSQKNNPHSISSNYINSLANGPSGKLWIGTDDGLNILDPVNSSFTVLRKKELKGINGNEIRILAIDTIIRRAWIACISPCRFFELDLNTMRCRGIILKDTGGHTIRLQNYENFSGIHYKQGCVLSIRGLGVFLINGNSLVAEEIIRYSNEFATAIAAGDDQFLFLKLYNRLDRTYKNEQGAWKVISTPIDTAGWWCIYFDKTDRTYWVSGSKLFHYNFNFKPIPVLNENARLWQAGVIVKDNNGNIWANNIKGEMAVFSPVTGRIIPIEEKDGYIKQLHDWDNPRIRDVYGDVYFAGDDGLDRISPARLTNHFPPCEVYLHSLEINGRVIPTSSGINHLDELSLKYFQNRISIETGNIDFYSKGGSRIRYKLEGSNNDWQYGSDYYTIRYEGLEPGKYRLVLQASNNVDEFTGPEKSLVLIISPPWWKTWWSYLIFAILTASLLWGFIQYRSRNLKARNIQLEEKVLHRTKELKYSLEELRSTQNQLIQSEKMASMGELTAGIAHEIQNPLNFVNNFSEVNTELIEELKAEIIGGNTEEAISLADNLLDNEQKVLYHGKRADSIVKSMLQHSRSSTGQKELTEINKLADEYLRLAYHGLRAKDKSFNAIIKTDFDGQIEKINIIPQDIGRVLLNLYSNAFYAVSEKQKQQGLGYEPAVVVSTKKAGNRMEIRVKDNGNGIPQTVLNKIFQPFFTTKPTGQGTGLGLSLSYDIVTKGHGGEMKVETKEGEYAEFMIYLPV